MSVEHTPHVLHKGYYLKVNTSWFGYVMQVWPSDIGEYLSSFFNSVVVVFIQFSFYNWKKKLFWHCKFFCQKESLLYFTYFTSSFIMSLGLKAPPGLAHRWVLTWEPFNYVLCAIPLWQPPHMKNKKNDIWKLTILS